MRDRAVVLEHGAVAHAAAPKNCDRHRHAGAAGRHGRDYLEGDDMNPTWHRSRTRYRPVCDEILIDPYPMHEACAKPARWSAYAVSNLVACARHDEVHAVFNDHEHFISGAGVGLTNFNQRDAVPPEEPDPRGRSAADHTQTRAVLSRILSPEGGACRSGEPSPPRPRH